MKQSEYRILIDVRCGRPGGLRNPSTSIKPAFGALAGVTSVKVAAKQYIVELENDQVRVARAPFSANGSVPLHVHRLPRVVVFLTDYRVQVTSEDRKITEMASRAGHITMPGPARNSGKNLSGADLK